MTATTDHVDEPTRADIMDSLRSDAEFYPRVFAIYGIYRGLGESLPELPFLGWGSRFTRTTDTRVRCSLIRATATPGTRVRLTRW
jgi:hypothetical protein